MGTMQWFRRGLGTGLWGAVALLLLACNGVTITLGNTSTAPTTTPDVVASAVAVLAQTQQAQTATATHPTATLPPTAVPQPTATATSLPTATPRPQATATPRPPSPTAAPAASFTARVDTRCRQGPGVYYPEVGAVLAGETVPILARSEAVEGYWLVQLPDGRTCWAWDRYATLQGDTASLPAATPPPAPEAAFSLFYVGPSECGANRGLTFEVVNRGPVPIESLYLEVQGSTYRLTAGLQFQWWLDCDRKGSAKTIYAGRSAWVTIPTGTEDLRGQNITVYAKACTGDNISGTCFERRVPLRP
ncbi:MAG: SH3 domain-containing protein [Chloroflexi bacterium]|nr:SH3 domain-containing protein [Chloroflexota bacterium]